MKAICPALLSILYLLSGTAILSAQVPHSLSYQGLLTGQSGEIADDDNYELHFALYDETASATALWAETQQVTVINGIFHVILGSVNTLDIAFDKQYYLGIAIGDDAELSPRIALTSSAYSIRAASVDDGQVVKSINSLKDDIQLEAGENITISSTDNTITISSAGSQGTSGITEITAGDGLTGGGSVGHIILSLEDEGVTAAKLASESVLTEKLADSAVTTSKLASESVTQDKLHPEVSLPVSGSAGGDLTGNYPNPVISENVITGNKIILPLILNGETTSAIFSDDEVGVYGESSADEGSGIYGRSSADNSYNAGVRGVSVSGNGVYGLSETGAGIFARTNSANGYAGIFQGRSAFEGRVGIGTYTPRGKLDLQHQSSISDPHLYLTETSADGFASIIMGNTTPDNRQWLLWAKSTSTQSEPAEFRILERNGNTIHTRFTMTESGTTVGGKIGELVGIGVGNPSEKLHVSGAIRIGDTNRTGTGTLRWTGSDFEGRFSDRWVSLTQSSDLWRIIPDEEPYHAPIIIGGHPSNSAGSASSGSIIAGGGSEGASNTAYSAFYATISGGNGNLAYQRQYSVISGGLSNLNAGDYSVIGGGRNNVTGNQDEPSATHGSYSAISGGRENVARGNYSMIPGGYLNKSLGEYSFAAGHRANANHNGSFVWADQTNSDFTSTAANQFLIRADGGVGIGTNNPQAALHLNTGTWTQGIFENVDDNARAYIGLDWRALTFSNNAFWTGSAWSYPSDTNAAFALLLHRLNERMEFRVRPPGGELLTAMIINTDQNVGIGTLTPGTFRLAVNGDAAKPGGGTWSVFSDERLKKNIRPLESGALERLLELKGYTFEYHQSAIEKRLALAGRQTGLIAREVMDVFPEWVDADDEGYLYVTERGTTAIIIEALRELRMEKDKEIADLRKRIEYLENMIMTGTR